MATEDYLNIDYRGILEDEAKKPMKQLEVNKQYVVGFAFNEEFSHVILVQKNKPADQVGKLNGPGGKVEPEDYNSKWLLTPKTLAVQIAMAREFREETGIETSPDQWTLYASLNDIRGWQIVFLFTTCNIWSYEQTTDESVVHVPLSLLHVKSTKLLPNLNWLIPMALTKHPKLPITDRPDAAAFFTVTELESVIL